MAIWLVKNKTTGEIGGWTRGGDLPPSTAKEDFIEINETQLTDFLDKERQAQAMGKLTSYANGAVVVPIDTRLYVNASLDKARALANGIDSIELTMQALNTDDTLNAFSGELELSLIIGGSARLFIMTFVAGLAQKVITSKESGNFTISTSKEVKLKKSVSAKFYE